MYGSATFAIVLSSACISVAIIAHILMMRRCDFSDLASEADGATAATLMVGSEQLGEGAPVFGVDFNRGAHAGSERRIVMISVDLHSDGDALYHFHPVAARILRGQQRKFGTASGADAFDRTGPATARISVDPQADRIADLYPCQV